MDISCDSKPKLSERRIAHYFELARNACYYSDCKRTRLGCIAIYKNKILSVGWNQEKTAPMQKELNKMRDFDPNASDVKNTLHAEVNCLMKIKDMDVDWGKVNLFVYRIKKDDKSGMARPCNGCMSLIRSLGIRNIFYSTDNGWAYERIDSE